MRSSSRSSSRRCSSVSSSFSSTAAIRSTSLSRKSSVTAPWLFSRSQSSTAAQPHRAAHQEFARRADERPRLKIIQDPKRHCRHQQRREGELQGRSHGWERTRRRRPGVNRMPRVTCSRSCPRRLALRGGVARLQGQQGVSAAARVGASRPSRVHPTSLRRDAASRRYRPE